MPAELYDVENALREAERYRHRHDTLAVQTAEIADDLAASLRRHFGPESAETAGLALVLGAASVGVLDALPVAVVCNVLGLAGQRLVSDSRLAEGADRG